MDSTGSTRSVMPSRTASWPPSRAPSTSFDRTMTYHYRRGASSGSWTVFLLPLALYFSDLKFNQQSFPAIFIITYNVIIMFALHSCCGSNLPRIINSWRIKLLNAFICTSAVLYTGIHYQTTLTAFISFLFQSIFHNFIHHYPSSFTFGEGMIVTCAFIYNFWAASQNIMNFGDIQESAEPLLLTLIIECVFFGSLLVARLILMYRKPWKIFFLEEFICVWIKVCFIMFTNKMSSPLDDGLFLMSWGSNFLFGNIGTRITLLVFWVICSLLGGCFLFSINNQEDATTTVDRKVFHILVCAVFLPAVLFDFNLIYFCSAIVVIGFLLIEEIRALNVSVYGTNFGEFINTSVNRFRDTRDCGKLILTPIYLLVGCSMPIWLTGLHFRNNNQLTPEEIAGALSGILSIGIGDTFASIGGFYYGRNRWQGTSKTWEGTGCSILAQLLFVVLFCTTGVLPYTAISLTALIISSVINAFVEAWTDQIDNLVLPLVTFNCIHIVYQLNHKLVLL